MTPTPQDRTPTADVCRVCGIATIGTICSPECDSAPTPPRKCQCGHADFEHAGKTHHRNECLGDDLACPCERFSEPAPTPDAVDPNTDAWWESPHLWRCPLDYGIHVSHAHEAQCPVCGFHRPERRASVPALPAREGERTGCVICGHGAGVVARVRWRYKDGGWSAWRDFHVDVQRGDRTRADAANRAQTAFAGLIRCYHGEGPWREMESLPARALAVPPSGAEREFVAHVDFSDPDKLSLTIGAAPARSEPVKADFASEQWLGRSYLDDISEWPGALALLDTLDERELCNHLVGVEQFPHGIKRGAFLETLLRRVRLLPSGGERTDRTERCAGCGDPAPSPANDRSVPICSRCEAWNDLVGIVSVDAAGRPAFPNIIRLKAWFTRALAVPPGGAEREPPVVTDEQFHDFVAGARHGLTEDGTPVKGATEREESMFRSALACAGLKVVSTTVPLFAAAPARSEPVNASAFSADMVAELKRLVQQERERPFGRDDDPAPKVENYPFVRERVARCDALLAVLNAAPPAAEGTVTEALRDEADLPCGCHVQRVKEVTVRYDAWCGEHFVKREGIRIASADTLAALRKAGT